MYLTHPLAKFCEITTEAGVGSFHVHPRFHPTDVGWNLGWTRKLPTPAEGHKLVFDLLCAILLRVEISTKWCICWNSRCPLELIFQLPVVIELFLNILPMASACLYSIRAQLHWKTLWVLVKIVICGSCWAMWYHTRDCWKNAQGATAGACRGYRHSNSNCRKSDILWTIWELIDANCYDLSVAAMILRRMLCSGLQMLRFFKKYVCIFHKFCSKIVICGIRSLILKHFYWFEL